MNDKCLNDKFDVHRLFESIWRWQRASGGDVDAVAYATAEAIIESYRRQRKRQGRQGLIPALRNLMYMRDALEQVVSDPTCDRMQRIRLVVLGELAASGLTHDAVKYRGYFRLNLERGGGNDQDSTLSEGR
jgi:predicted metal-dependent hydrolase